MATVTSVRQIATRALGTSARIWFTHAQQQVAGPDRSALSRLFPAVEWHCGKRQLPTDDPDLTGWTIADAVRAALLISANASATDLTTLYHYGDTAQRRSVLRALPLLKKIGTGAVPLVL